MVCTLSVFQLNTVNSISHEGVPRDCGPRHRGRAASHPDRPLTGGGPREGGSEEEELE